MEASFPKHPYHDRAVLDVSEQVRGFYETQNAFRIYHGSTNSTRPSTRRRDNIVDISGMNAILGIDLEAQLVFVESNCPMDALVDYCLQSGHAPRVVPEFPGITAGGAFSGTSGESSSFRHGVFHRTVERIEMVLGNGDIVVASDTVLPDLFHGAAATMGTLGVVTLLAVQIMPTSSYVSLTYIRVRSMAEATHAIEGYQQDETTDFIDGIFFARDRGVLCVGKFTTTCADGTLVRYVRRQDQWFYISAEQRSLCEDSWTETVPIRDYYFRYNLGAFWVSKYTFKYFGIPFTRLTRYLLHKYTQTRTMFHALHQSGLSEQYIIQDVAVPYAEADAFFAYVGQEFSQYPLWICPLRADVLTANTRLEYGMQTSTVHPKGYMLNFGIWGPGPPDPSASRTWNKRLETEIQRRRGQKWLYANTYYTKEEFWAIYDKQDALRLRYHASSLPTLYDKVAYRDRIASKVDPGIASQSIYIMFQWLWNIWPVQGLYGWLHCMFFADYLLSEPEKAL